MRELAKSMIRFSWAMSLFGLEQLGKLVEEKKEGDEERSTKVTNSFDSVSGTTQSGFSDRTRRLYDSGDQLQGEMVDAFFDFWSSDNWSPDKVLDRAADLAESSADALRKATKKESSEEEAEAATEAGAA